MKLKSIIIILLKIGIAAGLLYYLVYNINFNLLIKEVQNASYLYLFAALGLLIPNLYIQFLKWKITCNSLLEEKDSIKIYHSLFSGFSASIFTPMRVGEYVGRGTSFQNKSMLQVASATFVDKIFNLITILIIGLASGILFLYVYHDVSIRTVVGSYIVLGLSTMAGIFFMVSDNPLDNTFINKLKKKEFIKKIAAKFSIIKGVDRILFKKLAFLSIIFYLIYLIQYVLLVAAFSGKTDFLNYLWSGNLMIFVKTIVPSISLGELGIREGASIYFIKKMGGSEATGFNASIFLFFINVAIPAIMGLFSITKKSND